MQRLLRLAGIHKPKRMLSRTSGSLLANVRYLGTLHNVSRRRYDSPSNAQHLLSKVRRGEITKAEVQQLIIHNELLKNKASVSEAVSGGSTATVAPGRYAPAYTTEGTERSAAAVTGSSVGGTVSLGSKTNPVYMRKHTGFREFLFSLFPFVFIFWMLGGFDLVKNRKQAGVGGMFGKNYSEWDETDWEDDDDEMESDDGLDASAKNSILKQRTRSVKDAEEGASPGANPSSGKNSADDRRTEFFRRLGIKLDDKGEDSAQAKEAEEGSSSDSGRKKKQKRVRFRDVCGCEEAKADLQDLVDYLKHPEKYQRMGCKLPKGVLLSGPPGTGKTLLARALAGEAQVPFLATNGASFDEIFVGVGVMRVRKLFERAKEKSPCIVFIDEIDAIANTRMQMGTAHSSDSLNALLGEMDGFEVNTGIIVIAATNMPDRLDAALVRPGRFDRKVHIQPPDKKARRDIVEMYLKDRGDDSVDVDMLVSDIAGFSGAELESMVNLASIEAVKQGKDSVSMEDLIEAKEIISMGRARRTLEMSPEVKRLTAYHEGGHAVVSLFTKGAKPIYKATILPRGPALGFVASANEDEFLATKESLLAQLDTCMGGRAAEEIFNGHSKITTGASSDFNQATAVATAMVCQYGMSPKVGKVFYRMEDIPKLSPDLQNLINSEVKRLLDESYGRARTLIEQKRDLLDLLANQLLEKETLSGDEIRELLGWDSSQQREPIDFAVLEVPTTLQAWAPSAAVAASATASASTAKKGTPEGEVTETLQNNGLLTPQTELLNPQVCQ